MGARMFRKGLAVAVILLFIGVALLPSITAHDTEINDDITEPLDVGRQIIRGLGFFPITDGDYITFFVIRLKVFSFTEWEYTTYYYQWVTFPLHLFSYQTGRFNIIMFYRTTIKGDFQPEFSRLGMNNLMVR